MKITSRAAVLAAFGVGPLLLAAGCGGSDGPGVGAEATLARIQSTSYVSIPPKTTPPTTAPPSGDSSPDRVPGAQTYTVRPNDSISKIASLHDISMDQLINYNSWVDGINHGLSPGDVIKIPPGGAAPGSEPGEVADEPGSDDDPGDSGETTDESEEVSDDSTDPVSDGEGCTHTIVKDENPNRVANIYDITVDELIAANPGGVLDSFLVGATLQIPPTGNCG